MLEIHSSISRFTCLKIYIFLISKKEHVVDTYQKPPCEALLMGTQNMNS